MKKLFYFFSLLWCCAYLQPLYAQNTAACNAEFSFTLSGRTANFHSLAGLAAGTAHWWTFGDATNSDSANPTHNYSGAGTYWVTHYILNQATNCRDSFVRAVIIADSNNCNVQPAFTWRRDSANCSKVIFTNQTISSIAAAHYIWKFGDGTTSNDLNASHTYAQEGIYTVCLVVEAANNCRREVCKIIEVRCAPPPPACNVRAKFEWRRDSLQVNRIWFNNLSQPIPNIWKTFWTYGDGTSSQDFNSYHIYQQPGKYYVCLKVQSLNGCIDTYCDSVTVLRPEPCEGKPEYNFEVAANNLLEYKFRPKYINQSWKYYWSFGDGTSSTAIQPVHSYPHAGTYKVCLTIINGDSCRTTTCKEVRVALNCDDVKLKFEYVRNPQAPYIVAFHAAANLPIVQQTWTIVKLSNSVFPPPVPVVLNADNPTYTFKDSGWYMVCVYVIGINNCKRSYCERIYIEHGQNGRAYATGSIPAYPNPATRLVRLDIQVESNVLLQVRVLDGMGTVKMKFASPARAGNNSLTIPVEKLSSGSYVVEIRYGNQLKLAKFQKT